MEELNRLRHIKYLEEMQEKWVEEDVRSMPMIIIYSLLMRIAFILLEE